jgi:hypothetical protein
MPIWDRRSCRAPDGAGRGEAPLEGRCQVLSWDVRGVDDDAVDGDRPLGLGIGICAPCVDGDLDRGRAAAGLDRREATDGHEVRRSLAWEASGRCCRRAGRRGEAALLWPPTTIGFRPIGLGSTCTASNATC